jgi:hypothetical protein
MYQETSEIGTGRNDEPKKSSLNENYNEAPGLKKSGAFLFK